MRALPLWLCLVTGLAGSAETFGQGSAIPSNLRGQESSIARGVLNGNLIETNFRNHAELSRFDDRPWGVWPRGVGGRHVDGVGMMVTGQVLGERTKWPQFFSATRDTLLNPMILTYRDAGKTTGPGGNLWGWLPLPGFNNPNRVDPFTATRTPTPALSRDPSSWPTFWPDRLNSPDDPGWRADDVDQNPQVAAWNGFFGKGVFNADLESFYVVDDHSDQQYALSRATGRPNSPFGIYYPSDQDSTMGGFGLQAQVRLFQWANVLAEDVMFILYRITNVGRTNHQNLFFAQINDYGLGTEEGDEDAAYDAQQDVAYGWDQDGFCQFSTGGLYDCGYTGFAFLESPARASDFLDNDEDGITDESRFNGPGTRIVGEDAIRLAVAGRYNLDNFERFNGPLEDRNAFEAGIWWTGDENLDWVGFDDQNENGVRDPGELVNNDVGAGGLGPFDLGYPGPDTGEADGIPTPGEPNFGELDVDESDQIGLTGFDLNTRPFYESGDNLRSDTWLFNRVISTQFPLGQIPQTLVADVEPFILFSSGTVALDPQQTDFFSTAWLFGVDEQDFFKNRRTVQNIYNSDYNFAQPPLCPKLTAVPGDGRVVLSWDTLALRSFDRFSQAFDFEGFRLYRSTSPILDDVRTISNSDGVPTFYEPLAQWDLDNGIQGTRTVLDGTALYDLGADSGLSFYYVDDNVRNGVTYYYVLTSYDRGVDNPNNPQVPQLDPQECPFSINVNDAGRLTFQTQNAAVVVPRSEPAGFVAGGAKDITRVGIGTGGIRVDLVADQLTDPNAVYRINFFAAVEDSTRNPYIYNTLDYEVVRVDQPRTLIGRTALVDVTPPADGFVIDITNDERVLDPQRTGYKASGGTANEQYSLDPTVFNAQGTNWVARVREDTTAAFRQTAYDYEFRWTDPAEPQYQTPRLIGFLSIRLPLFAYNVSLDRPADYLVRDVNNNRVFDVNDELILVERLNALAGWSYRYRIGFTPKDLATPVDPPVGTVFRISHRKPFFSGDGFVFSLQGNTIDVDQARTALDEIGVVPNPYIATSLFEPRLGAQGAARGERRLSFVNLPATCTVRIYTIRGELVRTLVHDGGSANGSLFWDLRTDGGQDIAFGIYLYHVDAPGIGEHVGKFAVVK